MFRLFFIFLIIPIPKLAASGDIDYAGKFAVREGCFIVKDTSTGKTHAVYNEPRCKKRFPTCSTFKLPLAAIAFERKLFTEPTSKIKWDGHQHRRKALNQDQTAKSYLEYSVNWVSEKIVQELTSSKVNEYLENWNYGNAADVAMPTNWSDENSSFEISPVEQTEFLKQLWEGRLTSKFSLEALRNSMESKAINSKTMVFGKTGSHAALILAV